MWKKRWAKAAEPGQFSLRSQALTHNAVTMSVGISFTGQILPIQSCVHQGTYVEKKGSEASPVSHTSSNGTETFIGSSRFVLSQALDQTRLYRRLQSTYGGTAV